MKRKVPSKKDALKRAAHELAKTKLRFGLGPNRPLGGFVPDPLTATTWKRGTTLPRTSDRIPGSSSYYDLMHAYKWRRDAREKESTVREIRRKATQIAPAYNKGALQYLPLTKKRDNL